jgi:hypothetical protein
VAVACLLVALVACTAGAPGRTPGFDDLLGPDESVWPSVDVDPALCTNLALLLQELQDVRETRLRQTAGELLQRRFEDVRIIAYEVDRVAPYELANPLNVLWDGVNELALAVEDYRTTDQPTEAAAYIRRASVALQRAAARFRRAAHCTGG